MKCLKNYVNLIELLIEIPRKKLINSKMKKYKKIKELYDKKLLDSYIKLEEIIEDK